MKKRIWLISALFLSLFLSLSDIQAQAKDTETDSALLYEITGRNLKRPSFLFGTIHLICQKDMFPSEKLNSYLNQTEQLLLEFDMDDPAIIQKALKASMLPDGKTLKDYVKAEEYAKIDELFKDYLGVSFDVLQTYKPLVSRTYLLSSPKVLGCQPPVVYDNFLAQAAVAAKMPVIGLETVEQQIAVIDSEPLEKQINALNDAVANPQKGFNDFRNLYQAYLTQNSESVYKQIVSQMKADYDLKKFLDERNLNWIPVIEKNMASMPSFVAVGGGHLGGKKGVVKLLRAKGYKLKPIRF